MTGTGGDLDDITESGGNRTLLLAVVTPGDYGAVFLKGKAVPPTGSDLNNIGKLGNVRLFKFVRSPGEDRTVFAEREDMPAIGKAGFDLNDIVRKVGGKRRLNGTETWNREDVSGALHLQFPSLRLTTFTGSRQFHSRGGSDAPEMIKDRKSTSGKSDRHQCRGYFVAYFLLLGSPVSKMTEAFRGSLVAGFQAETLLEQLHGTSTIFFVPVFLPMKQMRLAAVVQYVDSIGRENNSLIQFGDGIVAVSEFEEISPFIEMSLEPLPESIPVVFGQSASQCDRFQILLR